MFESAVIKKKNKISEADIEQFYHEPIRFWKVLKQKTRESSSKKALQK